MIVLRTIPFMLAGKFTAREDVGRLNSFVSSTATMSRPSPGTAFKRFLVTIVTRLLSLAEPCQETGGELVTSGRPQHAKLSEENESKKIKKFLCVCWVLTFVYKKVDYHM